MEVLHSPSKGKNSCRLQIVPWYNKKEWLETYHQTYSQNVELQEKSYTQMCIWKARHPNLPLGVECTMSMLHVMLCDKQTAHVYQDRDLQLLYSTAVMRFLNHLSVMSNCDSMYKMADQQKIPDWLINLRHEAAHGNSLPDLYLLRQASQVIMQWLRVHYWEREAEVMEEFYINRKTKKENEILIISEMLDLWIDLKANYWAGLKTIDNLPTEKLRRTAMELALEEGKGIKRLKDIKTKSPKRVKNTDENVRPVVIEEEDVDLGQEYTHKIKTAFDPLVRRLFAPLKQKKHKKNLYQQCLVETLVDHPGFCPKINVDKLTDKQWLQLMSLQGDLWKEVLIGVQSHFLLPQLLNALIMRQSQFEFVHVWLRLLTQLLCGNPPSQPLGEETICQILAESLPCEINPQVLIQRAKKLHMRQQKPLELKPASFKETEILQELAQKVLDSPTKYSSNYLFSLLNLWDTPLSIDTKKKLCALAQIYSGEEVPQSRSTKVFTLASLLDHGLTISQLSDPPVDEDIGDLSPWTLYNGNADWSKCALGTLPW